MRLRLFSPTLVIALIISQAALAAAGSLQQETAARDNWAATAFGGSAPALPLSFTLDGIPSSTLLKNWKAERAERKIDDARTEIVVTCTDPKSGLSVRCVAVRYDDFAAIEWTPFFKNGGSTATPIISDIQALDTQFERAEPGAFLVHHAKGSPAEPSSYEPRSTELGGQNRLLQLATNGGRSSNSTMPYWRVSWEKRGLAVAVGWPGQWSASLESVENRGLRLRAGQGKTHFKLLPGEEVRAPLIAVLFWSGEANRGHNLWRSWMLAHNVPRFRGALPPTQMVACSSHQFNEMLGANEANQKLMIDRYVAERLPLRYWWMDAGWYVNNGKWNNTGTWEVDRKRFPNGLRAITDHGRAKGVKSIVWFEPERVTTDSWLFKNHPEWCLPRDKSPAARTKNFLLNLGDPAAWAWVVEHIDSIIKTEGIDFYRQDFNIDPLSHWQTNDAPDRQGISEIRYVTGFLAFWDELRRRHPDMPIDNCASGGRRNDIETLRRSIPLLRDDFLFEPASQQCHTYGISYWIPYHGTGTRFVAANTAPNASSKAPPAEVVDPYLFRSHMAPSLNTCWDVRRENNDYDALRRLTAQFEKVAPCYLGDYYPLTGYSLTQNAWMAWQFDLPEQGRGLVQVFRRKDSECATARFKLFGLDAKARYLVENLDGKTVTLTGAELMEAGLPVSAETRPSALVFTYQRQANPQR